MKVLEAEIQNEVGELLDVLRADSEFIKGNLEKLGQLRELVIKRDDDGLSCLLTKIRCESQDYSKNVSRRLQLREKIASELGWAVKDVRLSRLEQVVPQQLKQQISEVRRDLQQLSDKMKTEHTSTAMLLKELSRFNSMILNAMFEGKRVSEITYSSSGQKKRQRDSGIVNMRL
ncbi:MAG: hypothetical protein JW804_06540 [Sedimentisphaerales bacterium]|nr:hypothetical protein [Sedimentisphaerales bacterium]